MLSTCVCMPTLPLHTPAHANASVHTLPRTHFQLLLVAAHQLRSLSLELGCLSLQIREESWVVLIFSFKQSCFLP